MRSPNPRLRTIMRGAAVALLVILSGCAADTPGAASTAPYQAPASTAISATELPIPQDAVGVSQDGATIAVQTKNRVCLVPRTKPAAAGVCATLPTRTGPVIAGFSPSGSQLALQENYQYSYHGAVWIADSKSGALRKVTFGAGSSASPSAAGSAAPSTTALDPATGESAPTLGDPATSSSSASTSDSPGGPKDLVFQLTWTATGQLIGAGPDTLVVVDPQRATATVVARTTSPIGWMVAGQSRVLAQLAEDQKLVAIDLHDGSSHPVPLSGKAGYFPMAVSPDGTHAVFGPNPGEFLTNVPAKLVDLDSGTVTAVPGLAAHDSVFAAAYSPDSSALALIVHGPQDDQRVRVLTMPAAGGSPHLAGTGRYPPFGIIWTIRNQLIPIQQVGSGLPGFTLHG